MIRTNRLLLPLLAGALALGACDDGDATGAGFEGTSRVSLLLTDAPGDVEAAVVTITDVYLQPTEGGDSAQKVYLLQDASVTTDLLKLSNDFQTLVQGKPVPAGRYEQLRIRVSGAYIRVAQAGGGSAVYATEGYSQVPAGSTVAGRLQASGVLHSGLKVILDGGKSEAEDGSVALAEGDQTLVLDFDVSRSFTRAGNSGQWVMKPTLKATRGEAAAGATVTLALADTVKLPLLSGTQATLAAFGVTLTPAAGGDVKTATFSDADRNGVYEARFGLLAPGSYTVALVAPAGLTVTTDPVFPQTLAVTSGGSASLAVKVLTAK